MIWTTSGKAQLAYFNARSCASRPDGAGKAGKRVRSVLPSRWPVMD
jgi:hypothetical protein